MILDLTKSLDLVTDETDFTVGSGVPFGSSQHFDFVQNIVIPGGLPDNVLSVTRASQALPESATGTKVRLILDNKLMITTAGLHVWEQRTNVVPDSVNFTTWSKRGTPIVNDRNQLAPDGTFTATDFNLGNAGVKDFFQSIAGLTASTNHEVSFWVKRGSTTGIFICQKTTTANAQQGEWRIDMSLLPDTFIRLTENHPSVTVIQNFRSSTTGALGLFFVSGDGTFKDLTLWGVQMEEGGTVSPYVSTAGVIVARAKDEITQPVSQMGFGANEGMIVIDLITPDLAEAPGPTLFSLNDGTINKQLLFFRSGLGYRLNDAIPGQSNERIVTSMSDSTRHKIAFGWQADGKINVSVDGGTVQTFDVTGGSNFNPSTTFNLGSDVAEGSQLNSTINSLTSYPNYSDALLQSRSA